MHPADIYVNPKQHKKLEKGQKIARGEFCNTEAEQAEEFFAQKGAKETQS